MNVKYRNLICLLSEYSDCESATMCVMETHLHISEADQQSNTTTQLLCNEHSRE